MSSAVALRIYNRVGNLFRVYYTGGVLYKFETNPVEKIGPGKTIFFSGAFYSYENGPGAQRVRPSLPILKSMITRQFALALRRKNYKFKGRNYRPYRVEAEINHPHKDIFSIYEGFEFRMVLINGQIFLCIDPHIMFETKCSVEDLVNKGVNHKELNDFSVSYSVKSEGKRRVDGYLLETISEKSGEGISLACRIKNYRDFKEVLVPAKSVIPEPRPELIQELLNKLNRNYDVISLQRKLSFLDSKTASKDRLFKTMEIAKHLQKEVFPLKFGEFKVKLEAEPIVVRL